MKQSLKRKGVENVLKKGERSSSGAIKIVYGNDDEDVSGCAILIPKKSVRGSVDRNKLRRKIREMVRNMEIPFRSLVVIYNGRSDLPADMIKKDIEQTMKITQ